MYIIKTVVNRHNDVTTASKYHDDEINDLLSEGWQDNTGMTLYQFDGLFYFVQQMWYAGDEKNNCDE